MAKTTSDKLTVKHLIGYGCGDCGGSITLWMMAGYMTRFLQVHLQINAGVLATILLIWNIWDAVNDPLMGTIMDVCFAKAKPGADKFRPWILASIPVIVIGMVGFFWVPPMLGGGWTMVAAAFVLKIVYEGGYTMMNIGMGSLLGNMAKNDAERASLASARGFGSTFAQLIGGFMIPQIISHVGDNTQGYFVASVACAIVGGVIIFLHYALTEERNKVTVQVEKTPEELEAEKIKITDLLNIFKQNRAFLALVIHSLATCAVQGMGSGADLYMYADVLGDIGLQSYFSTLSSFAVIGILIITPFLAKKWDLVAIIRVTLVAGFVAYAALLAYALVTPDLNGWVYVIWSAIAYALVLMSSQMQWGLVAEAIDYNEYLTGKRNEGTIYGFFSLSRRIGTTIASSATVLLIAVIGYSPELAAAGAAQAQSTISGIKMMVIGLPLVGALLSWIGFTFVWNINADVRAKMSAWRTAKTGN